MIKTKTNIHEKQMAGFSKTRNFEVVTIAGYRYKVTLQEVFEWFTSWRWWGFLAMAQVILITLLPHNHLYGLSYPERVIFWPLMTCLYIGVYILCMLFGARFSTRKEGRFYYTPIGMIIATISTTYFSTVYIGIIHNEPPDFSIFKGMEIVFNMLWASIFEAFHFAFNVPRIRKKRAEQAHEWEKFK